MAQRLKILPTCAFRPISRHFELGLRGLTRAKDGLPWVGRRLDESNGVDDG